MAFYATANIQSKYKQDYISTASPVELILMLYAGCIKQLKLAKIFKETGEDGKISECIEKAEDIILELVRSLNMSIPISNNLLDLYQFMVDEMVQIDLTKDVSRIDPIIEMLTALSEAWDEVKVTVESKIAVREDEG